MTQCMKRDCTAAATCMVGLEFYVDPGEAAEYGYPVDKPVARASTGLVLCRQHYEVFLVDGSLAVLIGGEAVRSAATMTEASSGFGLDRGRTCCVALPLEDPSVTLREHAVSGFINRQFMATVPAGVWLN